eukprot:m.16026 g.16026  ORF g.16026 m.16026 type:complete len:497 (+) comp10835_c0_seq1:156-1646(+)
MRTPLINSFRMFERVTSLFVQYYALYVVQFWFDYPIYFLKWCWDRIPGHVAIDGYLLMDRVRLDRNFSYGKHRRETFHLLRPPVGVKSRTTIVYFHGGGFVCSCKDMYYNSFAYLSRRNFTTVAADYPLAPQDCHPHAVISVLRLLAHLNSETGTTQFGNINNVHLAGDSAGSNLILLAAALLHDPLMFSEFKRALPTAMAAEMAFWKFPRVLSCISIYGMTSRLAAENVAFPVGLGLRYLWRLVGGHNPHVDLATLNPLPVSFDDYLHNYLQKTLPSKLRLVRSKKLTLGKEIVNQVPPVVLPPTLFVVGDKDFLYSDNVTTHSRMRQAFPHVDTQLNIYPGHHGLFAMPPEWQTQHMWRSFARPCSEDIYNFLNRYDVDEETTPTNLTSTTITTRTKTQTTTKRATAGLPPTTTPDTPDTPDTSNPPPPQPTILTSKPNIDITQLSNLEFPLIGPHTIGQDYFGILPISQIAIFMPAAITFIPICAVYYAYTLL